MTKRIAIVGAGLAGLHLGLYLRQHDIDVTLFTDRSPEDYVGSRLLNTVTHHAETVERERTLGVEFWPAHTYGYFSHWHHIGVAPDPLFFRGDFAEPSRAVDYRVYLPRLMEELAARGGRFEYREISAEDVVALSERFDLVVVSAGKGTLNQMFPVDPALSPYSSPQRRLCVGFYTGIVEEDGPRNTTLSISPGHGELIDMPTWTRNGWVHALLMENIPGGDLEEMVTLRYEDDPRRYLTTLLDKLAVHHPTVHRRISVADFDLAEGPRDLLQGAFTPTVRQGHVELGNGRIAMALGDTHMTVDPLVAQGANTGSYAAFVLGEEIVANPLLDARFAEKVELRRADRVATATRWTNLFLDGGSQLGPLLSAMSASRALADEFTTNFSRPDQQWDLIGTPERTAHTIASRGPVAVKPPMFAATA